MISALTLRHLLIGAALIPSGLATGGEPPAMTRIAAVRSLSKEEAQKSLPVDIRGVVIWQSADSIVVHDGERGIYVDRRIARERGIWKSGDQPMTETEVGALIEMQGVTDPGGYAPTILPRLIKRVGSGMLPPPSRLPSERLLSGSEDSQWIEVEGVVQAFNKMNSAGETSLSMMVNGHPCGVTFQNCREVDASEWVDARVKIRGVLAPLFNLRSEVAGMKIISNDENDVEILKPAPSDPLRSPRVALNHLLPFSPDADPYHRKVTHGVVTFSKPGEFFFLQDGNTGVRIQSPDLSVREGDALEVAGFVETGYTLASLGSAIIRKLEPIRRLDPVQVTANGILNPNFLHTYQPSAVSEDFNGRLVRLSGKLIKAESNASSQVTTLLIESGGHTFEARLPRSAVVDGPATSDLWPEGAVLDLTAVCELEFATEKPTVNFIPITGFHLWLRSQQDVRVLNQPSWWTLSRLKFALLGSGCVILLGIAWIGLLRRLLRNRTRRFEQAMRSHRNAELEYTAAQRERLRLAVDLHDGIKQHLAAASFRMEAAAGNLPNSPQAAMGHLEAASNTLVRTQTELEECLWGLHAVAEGPPELVHLLRHVTANSPQWPEGAVTVASEGTPLPLSRDIAGSLLLLFQEATANAFRHGRASHVAVTVTYGVDALDLRMLDDGVGFDPQTVPGPRAGHFGIEGMKKRMQWLRGTLQIKRRAGGGMEIHAHLPWRPMTSNEVLVESETNSNTRQVP